MINNTSEFCYYCRIAFFLSLFIISSLTQGQELRIKGTALAVPYVRGSLLIIKPSIGTEIIFNKNISVQLIYQDYIEWGEHSERHQRFIPSLRYYTVFSNEFLSNFFLEPFFRASFIKQTFEGLSSFNCTNSFGLNVGRRFNIGSSFSIEPSLGYYYIFSGNSNADRPWPDLFYKYGSNHRWKIDIMFCYTIKKWEGKF